MFAIHCASWYRSIDKKAYFWIHIFVRNIHLFNGYQKTWTVHTTSQRKFLVGQSMSVICKMTHFPIDTTLISIENIGTMFSLLWSPMSSRLYYHVCLCFQEPSMFSKISHFSPFVFIHVVYYQYQSHKSSSEPGLETTVLQSLNKSNNDTRRNNSTFIYVH